MPRISWLDLMPLDRPSTEAQIAQLLGTVPHQSLVREVFSHTDGNAYMNQLLVEKLGPETRHLAPALPNDLKSAVLRSWHGLSSEAQELTQVLAVGGRPITATELNEVMQQAGWRHDTSIVLCEAASTGITECDPEGNLWWFHHPLIPQCLKQELEGDRRRFWHTVFAASAENGLSKDSAGGFESLTALAHHHDAAAHTAEAYTWTVRAAAAVGQAGGAREMLHLLQRALALQEGLVPPGEKREKLLNRLRTEAEALGAQEAELEALDALLMEIDEEKRPLDVAELLVRRTLLRFLTGVEFFSASELLRAVRLAQVAPESWQYAFALAQLAHVGLWKNDPEARRRATRSMDVALAAGNPMALSYALTANSMAALVSGRSEEARLLATRAATAAMQAADSLALIHATVWEANATEAWASQAFADLMHSGRQRLAQMGSPHVYLSKLAADEAAGYLAIGRWQECARALRVALGSNPGQ